jgi:8-oxo-dGTP pyrophosphatase MutT (NUDIX family)
LLLDAAARTRLSLPRVRAALTSPVDVDRAAGDHREAAVLIPLFEELGETRVILTRRAPTLRSHRHEVSFPGGVADPGEPLVAAALREAWEEVGLDPARVEIVGSLGALTTVSSGALITPFVGVLVDRPPLHPNPAEVEHAFDVALADLLADGVHRAERWSRAGEEFEVQFFDLPADIVWGATARILTELLRRVLGLSVAG